MTTHEGAKDRNMGGSELAREGPVHRRYEMRLSSRHEGADNQTIDVEFALRREGEGWEPFLLSVHGSPFLNFLHSAFMCQHAYLRMNATELHLRLERVHGRCLCDTSDFTLVRFHASFAIELGGGEASDADLAYLRERCLACPVSRNLSHVPEKDTAVTVGTHATWSPRPG